MLAAEEARLKADIAVQKEKSLAAGGLFVLGTERHDSRRIDKAHDSGVDDSFDAYNDMLAELAERDSRPGPRKLP